MTAHLIAEHKIVILPKGAGFEPVSELLCPVLPQQLHHRGSGGDHPALIIFGGNQAVFYRLAGVVPFSHKLNRKNNSADFSLDNGALAEK